MDNIEKNIKENGLDKFCRDALSAFKGNIQNKEQIPHQRDLLLYKNADITNRKMALIFLKTIAGQKLSNNYWRFVVMYFIHMSGL